MAQLDGNMHNGSAEVPHPGNGAAASAAREAPFSGDIEFLRTALPHYTVITRLAAGGQGVVYRARNGDEKSEVAIKVLLDGPLAGERESRRLQQEALVLHRLKHPNIVALRDAGVVRGRPYLVSDFVKGTAIDDFCILNDFGPRQIVELLLPICDAVASAHDAGIVHRDLKPANILIDEAGCPRLLDFGLARSLTSADGARLSRPDAPVGTALFLSPEQIGGRDADFRSDVYGLGLVLYTLLSDGLPFPLRIDREAALREILTRDVTPLREIVSAEKPARMRNATEISTDLDAIVLKALARRPSERYATAAELRDDLHCYLRGQRPEAQVQYQRVRARRWRRRWGTALAASAVTALLTAAAAGVMQSVRQAHRDAAVFRQAAIETAVDRVRDAVADIDRSRDDARGYEQLAQIRNRLMESMSVLGALAERTPDDPQISSALAELYLAAGDTCRMEGKWSEAACFYDLLRNLARRPDGRGDPATARVWAVRAGVRLGSVRSLSPQEFEQLIPEAESLLRERMKDGELRFDLATMYLRLGSIHNVQRRRIEEADCYARALELAPEEAWELPAEDRWRRLISDVDVQRLTSQAVLGEANEHLAAAVSCAELYARLAESWPYDIEIQTKAASAGVVAARHLRAAAESAACESWATCALHRANHIEQHAPAHADAFQSWREPAIILFGLYLDDLDNCDRAREILELVERKAQPAKESEPRRGSVTSTGGALCRLRALFELECGSTARARAALECFQQIEQERDISPFFTMLKSGLIERHWANVLLRDADDPDCLREAVARAEASVRIYRGMTERYPGEEMPMLHLLSAQLTLARAYIAGGNYLDRFAADVALESAATLVNTLESSGRVVFARNELNRSTAVLDELCGQAQR